jgi:hypothetical protein
MAGQGRARRGVYPDSVSLQGHCCCLYDHPRERIAILAEFLGTALAHRKKCVYVARRVRSLADRGTITPGKRSPSINTLVRNVVGLMEPEIRSANVILRLELSHAIPEVIGDEVQLQQVLLNLIWATPNGARGACFRFSLPPRRRAYR